MNFKQTEMEISIYLKAFETFIKTEYNPKSNSYRIIISLLLFFFWILHLDI